MMENGLCKLLRMFHILLSLEVEVAEAASNDGGGGGGGAGGYRNSYASETSGANSSTDRASFVN